MEMDGLVYSNGRETQNRLFQRRAIGVDTTLGEKEEKDATGRRCWLE